MQLLNSLKKFEINKMKHVRMIIMIIIMVLILTMGLGVSYAETSSDNDGEESREEFTIEVVEDIEAFDIDEQETPLADVIEEPGTGIQTASVAIPLAVLIIGTIIIVLPRKIRQRRMIAEELDEINKAFSKGDNI